MAFDGACSKAGSGAGIALESPNGEIFPHSFKLKFRTNNIAKYETLIQGFILAQKRKMRSLLVTGDSELIVKHVKKKYSVNKGQFKAYVQRVWRMIQEF